MEYLVLCISIALSILIWPVNRWAMKNNARMEGIGLSISLTGFLLACIMAVLQGQALFEPMASLFGAVMGIAYAVGFCMIIFYCLKIGPSGPTVTVNNLGSLGPVLISILFFSQGKTPPAVMILGIIAIFSALILMGFNRSPGTERTSLTSKWIKWVLIGWMFSCISLSSQFFATYYSPDNPYTFAIGVYAVSSVILLGISLAKKNGKPRKVEVTAGVLTGVVNIIGTPIMFYLVKHIPAYVVFPVTLTAPILFMLLAGHFFLGEKLNRYGWAASLMGVAGLVLINL